MITLSSIVAAIVSFLFLNYKRKVTSDRDSVYESQLKKNKDQFSLLSQEASFLNSRLREKNQINSISFSNEDIKENNKTIRETQNRIVALEEERLVYLLDYQNKKRKEREKKEEEEAARRRRRRSSYSSSSSFGGGFSSSSGGSSSWGGGGGGFSGGGSSGGW